MATIEEFMNAFQSLSATEKSEALNDFVCLLSERELLVLHRKMQELAANDRRNLSIDFTSLSHELVPLSTEKATISDQMLEKEKQTNIRDVIRNLALVSHESLSKKEDWFGRVRLYTKSIRRNPKKTYPLKKRMLIHVDFIGVGDEFKGNHPAIVWYTEANSDRVLVIPCTSFKPESTVISATDIHIDKAKFYGPNGTVLGELDSSTVALLDQMQAVSRKRITSNYSEVPGSNPKSYLQARINAEQVRRIEEGLRILLYQEQTMYEKYIYKDISFIPEFVDHDTQYEHLFRIVHEVKDTSEYLDYTIEDEKGILYRMLKQPSKVTVEKRKELLRAWIRPKAVRDPVTKKITVPTPIVRENAYNALKTAYIDVQLGL